MDETVMKTEFEYIMSISEKLEAGKWIAVIKEDIIKGENAKEVFTKAKSKYPNKEPFIMKVPENANMLL
jgi:predicted LPLAT superfamily acyltransferase